MFSFHWSSSSMLDVTLQQAGKGSDTGEPPQRTKGADPRNGGRRSQNRTGANPMTGFQVPYAVLLNNVRHLELSEVVPLRL